MVEQHSSKVLVLVRIRKRICDNNQKTKRGKKNKRYSVKVCTVTSWVIRLGSIPDVAKGLLV